MADRILHLPEWTNFAKPEVARYGFYLEIQQEGDFVDPFPDPLYYQELRLNPQSIRMREPDAVAVTATQGGGVYIESAGWNWQEVTISGTTGHLPPGQLKIAEYNEVASGRASFTLVDQAARSGFADIHKLRYLFRSFRSLRKDNKPVKMHWMDFKSDEFWEIEPSSFDIDRARNSPFLYMYTISFKRIQPSEQRRPQKRLVDSLFQPPTPAAVASSVRRLDELRVLGKHYVDKASGYLKVYLQIATNALDNIVGAYSDTTDLITRYAFTEPLSAIRKVYASVDSLFDTIDAAKDLPDRMKREANAFALEVKELTDVLAIHAQKTFGATPGTYLAKANNDYKTPRAQGGMANDLVPEDPGNKGTPGGSLLLQETGLGAVIPNFTRLTQAKVFEVKQINHGETIFELAKRLYGSAHYFIILARYNRLQAPYIVADVASKLPGTLAWGEYINCPVDGEPESQIDGRPLTASVETTKGIVTDPGSLTLVIDKNQSFREDQWVGYTLKVTSGRVRDEKRVVISNTADTLTLNRDLPLALGVGDTYQLTLEIFTLRKAADPLTMAFGRDLLLVWHTSPSGERLGDLRLNARRDLAMISGLENFIQAMYILMGTEAGRNIFHPDRGLGLPIGRKLEATTELLYTFGVRRSLYQDPRVDEVIRPSFKYDGSVVMLTVSIKPRYAKTVEYFSRPLRGQ